MTGLKLAVAGFATTLLFLHCVWGHDATEQRGEARACLCDHAGAIPIADGCRVVSGDAAPVAARTSISNEGASGPQVAASATAPEVDQVSGEPDAEALGPEASIDESNSAEPAEHESSATDSDGTRATDSDGTRATDSDGTSATDSDGTSATDSDGTSATDSDGTSATDSDETSAGASGESTPYRGPPLSTEGMALQRQLDARLESNTIEFEVNRARIDETSYPLLDQLVGALNRWPDSRVEIQGHTDTLGSRARNLRLSALRAASVARYLSDHGIDASRMTTQGFGPDRPIASNATARGRQRNRRIQFQVVEGH